MCILYVKSLVTQPLTFLNNFQMRHLSKIQFSSLPTIKLKYIYIYIYNLNDKAKCAIFICICYLLKNEKEMSSWGSGDPSCRSQTACMMSALELATTLRDI